MIEIGVAHVVPLTRAEGPGLRTAIWTQGCSIRCPGCCNPELFEPGAGRSTSVAELLGVVDRAARRGAEGITLLGGEPFDQAHGLAPLAEGVRDRGLTVMVFSGHRLEHLSASDEPGVRRLLARTDVLVDGPYIEPRRSSARPFIGSDNQRVHHLTDRYRGHAAFDPTGVQSVDVRVEGGELLISGWPSLVEDIVRSRARQDGPE